ncbi:MAG: hypothetical protein WC285_05555 [Candidatus Gracilibacteria bacterium]|jgi:hypothetical protein
MGYIGAVKGSFIAFVIFVTTVVFIPGYGPSDEIALILTVSTFLFAILAGFFIARLNSRYDNIIDSTSNEDALWLSLYKTAIFLGKKFQDNVSELIDKYYIIAYDYELGGYYKSSTKYLHGIYDELDRLDSATKRDSVVFSAILNFLYQIENYRNKSAVLTVSRLTMGQWSVLLLLAGIIISSVFYIRTPDFYSSAVTVILSTVLVLVLLIMRDLQNFRLTGESPISESGQEVFEYMGKLRYYNKWQIVNGFNTIPAYVKKYRLGLHKAGQKFNIKIVSNG